MRKLLPILLAVIGLGGGIGAGLVLRPAPEETVVAVNPCGDVEQDELRDFYLASHTEPEDTTEYEYLKLENQFIVPVVKDGQVQSLVVLAIGLEVQPGTTEAVYRLEPKLRDGFLRVMFDHANTGGFDGEFTGSRNMSNLRTALLEMANKIAGPDVHDVLIQDFVRQDA